MKYCSECKIEIEEDIIICPQCGSQLKESQTPIIPQKESGFMLGVGFGFIVCPIFCCAVIFLFFIISLLLL